MTTARSAPPRTRWLIGIALALSLANGQAAGLYRELASDGRLQIASVTAAEPTQAQAARARIQYASPTSSYDIDRPPLGLVGSEDTSEFSSVVSPCWDTNALNHPPGSEPVPCGPPVVGQLRPPAVPDATIDAPVGNGRHLQGALSSGMPMQHRPSHWPLAVAGDIIATVGSIAGARIDRILGRSLSWDDIDFDASSIPTASGDVLKLDEARRLIAGEPGRLFSIDLALNFDLTGDGQVDANDVLSARFETPPLAALGDVPPPPEFEYWMPKRFGLDSDADGMVDYFDGDGNAPGGILLVPPSWTVYLRAVSPCNPGLVYSWWLGARQLGTTGSCHEPLAYTGFTEEGTYPIRLEVRGGAGVNIRTADVPIQDLVILSLGDSVGSGEGVPDKPLSYREIEWQDLCVLDQAGKVPGVTALNELGEKTCYTQPPTAGVEGAIVEATQRLCNGTWLGDACWAVLPQAGVEGSVIPEQPQTCSGVWQGQDCWDALPFPGTPGVRTPQPPLCSGIFQGGTCWDSLPFAGIAGTFSDPPAYCTGPFWDSSGCWVVKPVCSPFGGGCTPGVPGTVIDPPPVCLDILTPTGCWASVPVDGTPGTLIPQPDLCAGVWQGGACWAELPTDGVRGSISPYVPPQCIGQWQGGLCWAVLPTGGTPGQITPAVPRLCNGSADGFAPDGQCWAQLPFAGITAGAHFLRDRCVSIGPTGPRPGFVRPKGGSKASGAKCYASVDVVRASGVGWEDEFCHRSARAGSALAARRIEDADPRTSVSFLHLACSGSQIDDPGDGLPKRKVLAEQIVAANNLLKGREVDVLLLSIGGNDVKFSKIAIDCMLQLECDRPLEQADIDPSIVPTVECLFDFINGDEPFSDCVSDLTATPLQPSARRTFRNNLYGPGCDGPGEGCERLRVKYQDIKQSMLRKLSGLYAKPLRAEDPDSPPDRNPLGQRSGRVFLTEYMRATRGDAGQLCADAALPGLNLPETEWLDSGFTKELNDTARLAALDNGWNFVSGIYDAFYQHGLCALDNWVVRFYESFQDQGDKDGVIHPNVKGHRLYGERIAQSVSSTLNVGGMPRAPDPVGRCGDVDFDGVVSIVDAVRAASIASGHIAGTPMQRAWVDVDGHPGVERADSEALLAGLVGGVSLTHCAAFPDGQGQRDPESYPERPDPIADPSSQLGLAIVDPVTGLATSRARAGERAVLRMRASGASTLAGLEFDLHFDSAVVTLEDVRAVTAGGAPAAPVIAFHIGTNGNTARVALARGAGTGMSDQDLLELQFLVVGNRKDTSPVSVSMAKAVDDSRAYPRALNVSSNLAASIAVGTRCERVQSVGFAQAERVIINIEGPARCLEHDALLVEQSLDLNGAVLELRLLDDYVPAANSQFDVLDFAGVSGRFSAFDLSQAPLPAGLRWDTSALHTSGIITVVALAETVPIPTLAYLLLAALLLAGAWVACPTLLCRGG